MKWTDAVQQIFANMKIDKITFVSMDGYNSPDRSLK